MTTANRNDGEDDRGERRIPFVGITNLRDLGGYPAAGGTTRWGRLYRSDALHKLTTADLVDFRALGVRTVYDLRGDAERADFPGPVDSVHVPIVGRPARRHAAAAADRHVDRRRRADAARHVRRHPRAQRTAGSVPSPALPPTAIAVPCCSTATGARTAPASWPWCCWSRSASIARPCSTTTRPPGGIGEIEHQQDSLANILASGVSPEAAAGVLGAPRWAMADAVDAIDGTYGGIDAYLTGPAGVSAVELSALRTSLIDPG